MNSRYATAGPPCAAGVVEAHRSLTRTDLILCALPVALFLSILSLV
jgi:hypothetical protein